MSGAPAGTFGLVARTLATFGRGFGALAALAALALAAVFALGLAVLWPLWMMDASFVDDSFETLVFATAWAVVSAVEIGAVTSLALRRLRGERPTLLEAIGTGTGRLFPVAIATAISAAAVSAGVAVLVAPGLVALASLALAPPVAVDERGGPIRAVVRSLDLTRGQRGRVFGVVGSAGALAFVALLALAGAISALEPVVGETWAGAGAIFSWTLVLPLPTIASAVVYDAVREAKEAPRTTELRRVFG